MNKKMKSNFALEFARLRKLENDEKITIEVENEKKAFILKPLPLDDDKTLILKRMMLPAPSSSKEEITMNDNILSPITLGSFLVFGKEGDSYDLLRWLTVRMNEVGELGDNIFIQLWKEQRSLFSQSSETTGYSVLDFIGAIVSLIVTNENLIVRFGKQIALKPIPSETPGSTPRSVTPFSFTFTVGEVKQEMKEDNINLVEKNILEAIGDFKNFKEVEIVAADVDSMNNIFETFINNVITPSIKKQYEKIIELQDVQEKMSPLKDDLKVFTAITEATYIWRNIKLKEDPLIYTKRISLSKTIPFIAYVDNIGSLSTHIFAVSNELLPEESSLTAHNTIYFRIRGKETPLIKATYNVETKEFSLRIKREYLDEIKAIVRTELGIILESDFINTNINGIITSEKDFHVYKRSWLYTVMIDSNFRKVIRLSEQNGSNFYKNNILMSYQPFSDFIDSIMKNERSIFRRGDVDLKINLNQIKNGKFIMSFNKISSTEVLNVMKLIMSRLFTIYSNVYRSIEKGFSEVLGVAQEIKSEDDSLSLLQERYPHIFTKDYGSLVKLHAKRPRPLSLQEIKEWSDWVGSSDIRTVMTREMEKKTPWWYPYVQKAQLRNEILYLRPSNQDYIYFGFASGREYDLPELVPVYFNKPQDRTSTLYSKLVYGYEGKKRSTPVKSGVENRTLLHGAEGALPYSIINFFSLRFQFPDISYSRLGKERIKTEATEAALAWEPGTENASIEVIRIGIDATIEQLMLAIKVATQHDKEARRAYYLKEFTDDMKRDIRDDRIMITHNFNPGLVKQELYDLTIDEITSYVTNKNNILTLEYYRMVEEFYNVNIYVIELEKGTNKAIINTPRHIDTYIRPYTPREAVILFRHPGGQLDLIVRRQGTKMYTRFSVATDEIIFNIIYGRMFKSIIMYSEGSPSHELSAAEMWRLDYNFLWQDPKQIISAIGGSLQGDSMGRRQAFGQYIDSRGKRVATHISYGTTSGGGRRNITIYHPPQAPLNIPIFSTPFLSEEFEIWDMQPSAWNMHGLWFSAYGMRYGFFVQCSTSCMTRFFASQSQIKTTDLSTTRITYTQSGDILASTRIAPSTLMTIRQMSGTPRIGAPMQRNPIPMGPVPGLIQLPIPLVGLGTRADIVTSSAAILKQIIEWLFNISKLSAQNFVTGYITGDPTEIDDSQRYSFFFDVVELPILELKDAILYLDSRTTGLISKGKIVVPSALEKKLVSYLNNIKQRKSVIGLSADAVSLRETGTQKKNEIHLKSRDGYIALLRNRKRAIGNEDIVLMNHIPYTETKRNFVYENSRGGVDYFIELDDDLESSINKARRWMSYPPTIGYLLYETGHDGTPILVENASNNIAPYIRILSPTNSPYYLLMIAIS